MNLAIRGIEANLGDRADDSFHRDLHPDLRADFILANPPFNKDDWYSDELRDDPRWKFGVPPASNANFAWVQHIVYHLAPRGVAGFVLANGSLSSKQSGEGEIRRKLIEAGIVDCIVALPPNLFFNTPIPVSLWFVGKSRGSDGFRDRRAEVLLMDARRLGRMVNRTIRVFDDSDIAEIAGTYQTWRGKTGTYKDVAGFCKSAGIEEIASHDYVLNPGRFVGAHPAESDGEPAAAKLSRLRKELLTELTETDRLSAAVRRKLQELIRD
jgi:type I restriction enzyme M protein